MKTKILTKLTLALVVSFRCSSRIKVVAYRTNEGKPWVLPVVRTVESLMAADHNLDKEYLPVSGIDIMCKAATKLVLGEDCKLIASKKVITFTSYYPRTRQTVVKRWEEQVQCI